MKKKTVIIAAAVILIYIALAFYNAIKTDPNYITKNTTAALREDHPVTVEFKYDDRSSRGKNRIPVFSFMPDVNADYTFTVTDIVTEEGICLSMNVTDKNLSDYISADNSGDHSDSFEDTAFLNGGSKCFVIIEPVSETGNDRHIFSGSFTLSVSKAAEEAQPPELTVSEPVVITAEKNEQVSVLFRPEEDGYYRFRSNIVSNDKSGSSVISSVRSSDNKEVKSAEGICRLDSGKEYYIWISTDDLNKNSADIKVRCKRIETIAADKPGSYSITDDTIIEFTSDETRALAVYSDSDGDVSSSVYDSNGFPVSSDDDSGEAVTGNKKDFALVLQAQKNSKYLILATGKFSECTIVITGYTGDGTSLGYDDIEHTDEELETDTGTEADIDKDTEYNTEAGAE